jgi:hypothetical protein
LYVFTDVSEERIASICRVKEIPFSETLLSTRAYGVTAYKITMNIHTAGGVEGKLHIFLIWH